MDSQKTSLKIHKHYPQCSPSILHPSDRAGGFLRGTVFKDFTIFTIGLVILWHEWKWIVLLLHFPGPRKADG